MNDFNDCMELHDLSCSKKIFKKLALEDKELFDAFMKCKPLTCKYCGAKKE